jgi:hypothetical protein
MPDTAINTAQPLRLEQGGRLRIIDGATTYEVQNRDKGTVQLADGWYEPLRYNNKGEMQVPVEGDEQPSTLRAVVKLTSFDASQLLTVAQQRDTSTGKLKTYSLEIDWPDYKGASTGHKATIANAYFIRPVQIQEGQEFDTVTIEMESSEPKWTLAGY